jgi:hypothetical protein
MQPRQVLKFATVMGVIIYPLFTYFGVELLTEGKTVRGLLLLVCVAVGVQALISWRRIYR